MLFLTFKFIVVILGTVKVTEACNGYNLKINRIAKCLDASIIQPNNIDMTFDKDCNLVVEGCLEFTKPIKNAKIAYEVTKAPMPPITGDMEMCDLVSTTKSAQLTQLVNAFGLPKKCPVSAKKYCINGKKSISLSTVKNQLSLAMGKVNAKLNIEHDTGKSCVDVEFVVSKKK